MLLLLLLGVIVIFFFFGYFIMTKVDKFISDVGIASKEDKTRPIAVILGETELAMQVSKLIEDNSIRVLHLTEPFLFEREHNFLYLFALSENDADNIVLYKIGFKLYGIEKMICLCNDKTNESMFIKENITYISGNDLTAQRLYEAVMLRKGE